MKTSISVLVVAVLATFGTSPTQAQHLHQHGNHFDVHQNVPHNHDAAGHLTDSFGHHIDGHGNHTGSIGVHENGSFHVPTYTYPTYPSYPSTVSPSLVTPFYPSSPGVIYGGSNVITTAPPVLGTVTANRIPTTGGNFIPSAGVGTGGTAVLINPRNSGGSIRYSLNSHVYSMNPGESQTLQLTRDYTITFDNGLNRNISYRLTDGRYEFTVSSQTGWDIARRQDDAPIAPPSLSGNAIPNSLGSSPPPSTLP